MYETLNVWKIYENFNTLSEIYISDPRRIYQFNISYEPFCETVAKKSFFFPNLNRWSP